MEDWRGGWSLAYLLLGCFVFLGALLFSSVSEKLRTGEVAGPWPLGFFLWKKTCLAFTSLLLQIPEMVGPSARLLALVYRELLVLRHSRTLHRARHPTLEVLGHLALRPVIWRCLRVLPFGR